MEWSDGATGAPEGGAKGSDGANGALVAAAKGSEGANGALVAGAKGSDGVPGAPVAVSELLFAPASAEEAMPRGEGYSIAWIELVATKAFISQHFHVHL